MMDDKAMSLLGLMRRANAIQLGEDKAVAAVRAGYAKLLLYAQDVSENAKHRAERASEGRRVLHIPLHYTREDLGKHLGIGSCAMAAVTDIGFADAFLAELKKQLPEKYESFSDIARERNQKAKKRKRDTKARKMASTKGGLLHEHDKIQNT